MSIPIGCLAAIATAFSWLCEIDNIISGCSMQTGAPFALDNILKSLDDALTFFVAQKSAIADLAANRPADHSLSNAAYPIQKLLLNPCFLDSIFQAGGFYCAINMKQVYLPWYVEKLTVIKPPREKGKYTVYAEKQSQSDDSFCLNVAVCNHNEEVCYIAQNAHFHKIST